MLGIFLRRKNHFFIFVIFLGLFDTARLDVSVDIDDFTGFAEYKCLSGLFRLQFP